MANRPDGMNTHSRPTRASSTASISRSICSLTNPAPLEIRRALSRWQPQVVHVHENHDPRLLALASGYPTVFTVYDPVDHLGAQLLELQPTIFSGRADNDRYRRTVRQLSTD